MRRGGSRGDCLIGKGVCLMERNGSQMDCRGESRVRVVDFGVPSVQVEPVEGVSIRGVCELFGEVF